MASLKGSRNTAIGMFVDGLTIKIAKLSIKGKNVVVEELQSATLAARLEEPKMQMLEGGMETTGEGAESFTAAPMMEASADLGTGDNNSVMLGLLSKYPVDKYVLGYALEEPSIYYHVFETDFGLEGKKLKTRIVTELQSVRATMPPTDSVDTFFSAEKSLVSVIREDGLVVLRSLEAIKPFVGNRLPRISLIESADIALMNLARANFGFAPDDFSAVVYIGTEFTRIIFMKGSEFLHFAPVIGEGHDAPNIQNTVYSRLLLEQDNIGIPRLNKILLAGECHQIAFDEFLHEQLSDVEIQYLNTPYLDTSALSPETQEQIPEFAIPIATAWKILDDIHPAFYPINLLPGSVREGQKVFKLAWHGYLLVVLIFLGTFFFTSRFTNLRTETVKKENTLVQLQRRIEENQRLQGAIADLNEQIRRYNVALAKYDSLVPGADRWSRGLTRLTKGVEDVNSIWVTNLQSMAGDAMELKGYSLYRDRIPRIAAQFDNSTLSKVEETKIREKTPTVYYFTIGVPPQKEAGQAFTIARPDSAK